jgi:hypothetical protein
VRRRVNGKEHKLILAPAENCAAGVAGAKIQGEHAVEHRHGTHHDIERKSARGLVQVRRNDHRYSMPPDYQGVSRISAAFRVEPKVELPKGTAFNVYWLRKALAADQRTVLRTVRVTDLDRLDLQICIALTAHGISRILVLDAESQFTALPCKRFYAGFSFLPDPHSCWQPTPHTEGLFTLEF